MTATPDRRLQMARDLIESIVHPGVLSILGQEFANAYIQTQELERSHFHSSTHKETSPIVLRGLLETAFVRIAENIGGSRWGRVANSTRTSHHNELVLAGKIILSAARCHPWSLNPSLSDYRKAQQSMNQGYLYPELVAIPDMSETGVMLTGYFEHLPGASHGSLPRIARINFPTLDEGVSIMTIDLRPYFTGQPNATVNQGVEEIEEEHILEFLEQQKSN